MAIKSNKQVKIKLKKLKVLYSAKNKKLKSIEKKIANLEAEAYTVGGQVAYLENGIQELSNEVFP